MPATLPAGVRPPRPWRAPLFALVAIGLASFAGGPAVARAQSATEIIRGTVTGPDSIPLAGADVLITGLATGISQRTRSDERGAWTAIFANPESDYIIAVRRIGYVSTSLRLSRISITSTLTADVQLRRATGMLDTVMITSNDDMTATRAVGEVGSSTLAEEMFLADPRDLMMLLLSIPGVAGDSGISVLGAATSQNTQTLDGARFSGGDLPPDALSTARGITASADPAKGGFAGGSVATTLKGGTDTFVSTLRGGFSDPAMAWSDPAWTRPLSSNRQTSGTVNGPIKKGVARYNFSWRGRENATDWFSLASPREQVLAQQGIGLDTVAAVTQALNALGAPLTAPNIPRSQRTRSLSTTTVLDFTPSARSSIRLSHSGNWSDGVGGATSATAFPTRATHSTASRNFLSMKSSAYVRGLLNEFTSTYTSYRDNANPFVGLPSASVRVGTDFGNGRTGFSTLTFGGGEGDYYERTSGFEVIDELSWLPKNGKHKLKVGARFAYDQSTYYFFPESPLLGAYTYQSLADLTANRPASYERLLNTTARRTQAQNRAAWIGDEWVVNRALQLQGGLRFDFAEPITKPLYNPAVESLFGLRTDRIPPGTGLSPRLGFSWSSKARLGRSGTGTSSLGGMSAAAVAAMPVELARSLVSMQRSSTLPGIGVTGTIGAYRGATGTSTIAQYIESTGLGSRVVLSCVGAAVPVPDWRVLSAGPEACADGTVATEQAISSPLVRVFDPSFRAPTSWRANVQVDGIRAPAGWLVTVNAAGSYNVDNESRIDVNLVPSPRFHLAAEGNRPVYAPASAIVPATGAISPAATRVSPAFTTVTKAVSDLRSYSTQLQVSLGPPRPLWRNRVSPSFSYTLAASAAETRGSSSAGITGNPFAKEWVRNTGALHAFRMNVTARVWWFNFAMSHALVSGIRFTPRVSGDINGDGNSGNDRAFVPDPATTADTSLARQMNELVAGAPAAARRCLTSQFGRMASANGCRIPWQYRLDVSASLTPPSSWPYSDRMKLTFNTQNASGGLVRLLGLQNTPFGQTTLSLNPNTTLLYVTGFDEASGSFKYRVNQLFGQPTNFGSARQRFAPMQMQLGLEYTFGGPMLNPVARAMGFREKPGARPLTATERRDAIARLKRDPAARALGMKDSLALTTDQLAQIEALGAEYNTRADAALAPLTKWVVRKGKRVIDADLSPKLRDAQAGLARLNTEYNKRVRDVLTAEQAGRFGAGPR